MKITIPCLAALLAFGAAGCDKPPADRPAELPAAVELAPILVTDATVPVRVPAVLARKAEAELSFKVRGIVAEVGVRVGDAVTAGQVLARLQPDEIDAQVTQARSALEKAQRDLARVDKLEAGRVATFENLQDARTAVEVAAAQLRVAEYNRRFAVITAPAAGRILQRRAEPGELVESGRAVLAFAADAEGWLVRAGLSDRDLRRVAAADRAEVRLTDSGPVRATGAVSAISAAADAATRTTPVEVQLDAAPADARSGEVVVLSIQPRPGRPRAVVPVSALIEGADDAASVFVVPPDGHAARRVRVEIETIDGTSAYLRGELPASAQLVVRGAEYLRDGAAVAATPAAANPTAAGRTP
jgi:RND family efflux transporter MFP subunit